MNLNRPLKLSRYFLVSMILPTMLACSGGSTEPDGGCDDCGPGETQVATATTTPGAATIARGATTNATITYTASPGLTITGFHVQSTALGVAVNQTSTSGSGNNITRSYSITPGASVPTGTHIIRFWITVGGATNTVQTTRAEFNLTVT